MNEDRRLEIQLHPETLMWSVCLVGEHTSQMLKEWTHEVGCRKLQELAEGLARLGFKATPPPPMLWRVSLDDGRVFPVEADRWSVQDGYLHFYDKGNLIQAFAPSRWLHVCRGTETVEEFRRKQDLLSQALARNL